jgi:serine/threonine protein phosphatase PrpC
MKLAFRSEQGPLPRNEDCLLALESQELFIVCDGLSVKKGGDQAAQLAAEAIQGWALANQSLLASARNPGATKDARRILAESLQAAFSAASKNIFHRAASQPELHGMCTGVDVLLLVGTHALVGHVGAGRVYLVRKGEAHLLTEDHTQLAHLRRLGRLAEASPQQITAYSRRVTKAVGFQEEVQPDTLLVELEPGDRFLLITDGVWQSLGDSTCFSLAARPVVAQELIEALHSTVNETGSRDNFTSLVVDPKLSSAPGTNSAELKVKMLGRVPVLEYLSYQDILKVLSVGDLVKVGPGQELCKEGEPGGEMMLVLSGTAHVVKNGKVIRVLGKGDVFGEMSMLDAAPRSATVVAAVGTNLLAFPRDSLFLLFREDPSLSVKFLWGVTTEMNRRLRMASNQLVGRPEQEGISAPKNEILPFHRSP